MEHIALIEDPLSIIRTFLRWLLWPYAQYNVNVFRTQSPNETVELARAFANVVAITNRHSDRHIKIGLHGDPGSGKTTFADGVVNASNDLTVYLTDQFNVYVQGYSPSFGDVFRQDLFSLNTSKPPREIITPNSSEDSLTILEHSKNANTGFHALIDVTQADDPESENCVANFRVRVEARLARTDGFQRFLEQAQKFRL